MKDIFGYNNAVSKLRKFFQEKKGFVEVPTQSRLSILAACEDPGTIRKFIFSGTEYPLPQTGQMWLEYELLKNPGINGVFCVSTSYRDEANPIPGRHERVFPMFEFESWGDMNELRKIEGELLEFLGFDKPVCLEYEDICNKYDVSEIADDEEARIQKEYGNVVSLEKFPLRSSPFWNMKHIGNNLFGKIDVLLFGMETIGSAERSTNIDEMRENFRTISGGKYAEVLYEKFGKERVNKELDEYFELAMEPRYGAGIGVTRMVRALKLNETEKAKSKQESLVIA